MPKITDSISTADGTCPVRLFFPDGSGPWPGVVMYPDAGGVRDTFDQMAAELAGFGYAVLLPDVYYRSGEWAPFDMATVFADQQERNRLFAMIGVCGYCMGGRTSLIVAGRLPDRVAAAASFHGGGLVTDSDDSPHLLADRMSATVHVGGAQDDASFTTDHAEQLDKALTAAGVRHTIEWYSAAHGFAVPDNAPYDPAAAERHWDAMRDVFAAALPR